MFGLVTLAALEVDRYVVLSRKEPLEPNDLRACPAVVLLRFQPREHAQPGRRRGGPDVTFATGADSQARTSTARHPSVSRVAVLVPSSILPIPIIKG